VVVFVGVFKIRTTRTFFILRIHRAVSDVDFPLRGVVLAKGLSFIAKPFIELVLNKDGRILNYYSAMVKPNDIWA